MNIFKAHIRGTGFSHDLGTLILRLAFGALMFTHGFGKLQWVIDGNFSFGDPIGLGPEVSLFLVVFAEALCAVLVVLGLFFRPALIALIITMAVAAFIQHGADPLGDKEMALLYLGGYLGLFLVGSGRWSVDQLRR